MDEEQFEGLTEGCGGPSREDLKDKVESGGDKGDDDREED